MAHVVVRDNLYDAQFVKTQTDLSLLVRTDNMKLLKASDIIAGYANAELRTVKLTDPGEVLPPPAEQPIQYVPRDLREAWGDQVVWDTARNGPSVVTHDHTGTNFPAGVDPALEGTFEVTLVDGSTVKVRPVFDAVKQYLMDTCSPEKMSKVSWVPVEAIEELETLGLPIGMLLHLVWDGAFAATVGPNEIDDLAADGAAFVGEPVDRGHGDFLGLDQATQLRLRIDVLSDELIAERANHGRIGVPRMDDRAAHSVIHTLRRQRPLRSLQPRLRGRVGHLTAIAGRGNRSDEDHAALHVFARVPALQPRRAARPRDARDGLQPPVHRRGEIDGDHALPVALRVNVNVAAVL